MAQPKPNQSKWDGMGVGGAGVGGGWWVWGWVGCGCGWVGGGGRGAVRAWCGYNNMAKRTNEGSTGRWPRAGVVLCGVKQPQIRHP
jgi:hypothetical protein